MKLTFRKIISISFNKVLKLIPYFRFIENTRNSQTPISFSIWFRQKVLGFNKNCYWPVHHSSTVTYSNRVITGIDVSPGYSPACNIHGVNGIFIGDYTQIASGVGIQSGNHDVYDNRKQLESEPIRIGKYCWLGQNSVILPGVQLGDFTIVGAGAVVTKSFTEGHCVIAGVPAKKIKDLDKKSCIRFNNDNPFVGYISKEYFDNNINHYIDFKQCAALADI
jgi:acetyltransferase-like isoleucine patch superfamily enzyme